jgi:hypothetical protein
MKQMKRVGCLGALAVSLSALAVPASAQEGPTPGGVAPPVPGPPVAVALPARDAWDVYGRLTGRTVLRPSNLPALPASITAQLPTDTNAAIALMESELARSKVEVVRDGEKFVRVLRAGWRDSLLGEQLARIRVQPGHGGGLGAGSIDLWGVDLNQVLAIYAELRNRTILRPFALSSPPISLRTQNALTKEEVIYAFETVLAMNGVATVDDGTKFVQIVQQPEAARVQARAPKLEPAAALIEPGKVPVFKPWSSRLSAPKLAPPAPTVSQRIAQAYAKLHTKIFGPPPPPPQPNVDGLVAFYGKLAGRKPAPSKQFGQHPVCFEAHTPLTKPELLYAIQTTLALDGLVIVPVDDKTIRAGHISELRKLEKTSPATNGKH